MTKLVYTVKRFAKKHPFITIIILAVAVTLSLPYVKAAFDYISSPNSIYANKVYIDGNEFYLINYRNSTDPTYDELLEFIRNDNAGFLQAPVETAIELHNSAEAAGIKTGVAEIKMYNQEYPYIVNVFNTQDRGLIYIQSESAIIMDIDSIVTFSKNKECISEYLFSPYPECPGSIRNHGIVKDCTIHW
ncbi:hypothetical protein [uncultured Methanomethylovorans sp.]|uniref:hypothetical protein n=1 Tax=uncultured Methanomethylovorans sp. TaxID=183759 RepID=UPI002AA618EE|nr:hypothetical protein [uncultured Methanomethylovorans sp.]